MNFYNKSTNHTKGLIIVISGVIIWSFDALLIRAAGTGIWNILFWLGLFSFFSLGTIIFLKQRQTVLEAFRKKGLPLLLISFLPFMNLTLFVSAVKLTAVANVTLILSAAPLFASVLSAIFLKERSPLRTWITSVLCIIGVFIVCYGSLGIGNVFGDFLAILGTVSVASFFTSLRRFPDLSRLAIISIAGLYTAVFSFGFADPFGLEKNTYIVLAFMGLFQGPLARVLIGIGTRYLIAPEVALLMLIETIFAPILIWFAFGEIPPSPTFLGGAFILVALMIHTLLGFRFNKFTH